MPTITRVGVLAKAVILPQRTAGEFWAQKEMQNKHDANPWAALDAARQADPTLLDVTRRQAPGEAEHHTLVSVMTRATGRANSRPRLALPVESPVVLNGPNALPASLANGWRLTA